MHDGRRFAMKIQYPGVARSIESDVDNLMRLINIANLLPKGLYVEQAAEVSNMAKLDMLTPWFIVQHAITKKSMFHDAAVKCSSKLLVRLAVCLLHVTSKVHCAV